MEGQSATPGPNRTAAVAIIIAVVSLGAFVVVGIGVLLGWIPRGGASDRAPATAGTPAGKASRDLEKFAGSEPLMPRYSQPHAPPPAPLQDFAETRPALPLPMPAAAPAPQPAPPPASPPRGPFASGDSFGPAPPIFGRAEPRTAPEPAPQRRRVCEECGRIIGIANWRSGWEVRVRFDDGATETFPFRRRPPFDLGERVRRDGRELVRD